MNPNKAKINIGGNDYEFFFGIGFLSRMAKLYGVTTGKVLGELQERLKEDPLSASPEMMAEAHNYALKREGSTVERDADFFISVLDDDGGIMGTGIKKFLEAWTNSMSQDVPTEKKKLPAGEESSPK